MRCRAGKVGYRTKERAMRAKKHAQLKFGCLLRVYRCLDCGELHLTSDMWTLPTLKLDEVLDRDSKGVKKRRKRGNI